jgi:hypothetical protein
VRLGAINPRRQWTGLITGVASVAVAVAVVIMVSTPTGSLRGTPSVGVAEEPPYLFTSNVSPTVDSEALEVLIARSLTVAQACELTTSNTPWQIAHGIQAFGRDFSLRELETGHRLNAVDYLLDGVHYRNQVVPEPIIGLVAGKLRVRSEGQPMRVQDHPGQLLFILSQARVPENQQITLASGERFTVKDLVKSEAENADRAEDLSWLVPALHHYLYFLPSSHQGKFDVEPLVRRMYQAGVNWDVCYGNHSLFALASVLRQRRERNLPIAGVWRECDRLLQKHVDLARQFQNADGSFAPSWSYSQSPVEPLERLVDVSGHVLAWLVYAVPSDRLQSPWLVRAVRFLANALPEAARLGLSYKAISHGAHGMRLYLEAIQADRGARPMPSEKPKGL